MPERYAHVATEGLQVATTRLDCSFLQKTLIPLYWGCCGNQMKLSRRHSVVLAFVAIVAVLLGVYFAWQRYERHYWALRLALEAANALWC